MRIDLGVRSHPWEVWRGGECVARYSNPMTVEHSLRQMTLAERSEVRVHCEGRIYRLDWSGELEDVREPLGAGSLP